MKRFRGCVTFPPQPHSQNGISDVSMIVMAEWLLNLSSASLARAILSRKAARSRSVTESPWSATS
jgi:hypothetical protein